MDQQQPTVVPTKYAVSYIIFHPEDKDIAEVSKRRFVSVKRPATDKDLPNAWGLPAGMHDPTVPGRTWEDSVRISGIQKLGVELIPVEDHGEAEIDRVSYILRMRQFTVEVAAGSGPLVCPQEKYPEVTQYQECRHTTDHESLIPAAVKGSLCSRMFLGRLGKSFAPSQ